ncbi:hypothetical protein GPECTOR_14g91 [Gonium pectorale]|uniref:Uncharacterized protein n=1 Tax=Gonium pectorale TaxID=33097 RepID=A0A150GP59_GONPE|nr:hypothetical protein GPECTOR_14g91 [Gonium pectorale]|eukprot:KXZ51110.1 hypothetical protein GPECTOR_14g91 [Gonium pectorale]
MESRRWCQLDVVLAMEPWTDAEALRMLYPVNVLRNWARLQTTNETSSAVNIRIADRLANMGKEQLEVAVVLEAALPFHIVNFPAGHSATNFSRWFRAKEPYNIRYARNFEPWFVAGRREVPWHDVRLRGYGNNKIIQVAATNASGAVLAVHPSAFLVHRPHPKSGAKQSLGGEARVYRQALRQAAEALLRQPQYRQRQLAFERWQQQEAAAAAAVAGAGTAGTAAVKEQEEKEDEGQGQGEEPVGLLTGGLKYNFGLVSPDIQALAKRDAELLLRASPALTAALRTNLYWSNNRLYSDAQAAMAQGPGAYRPALDSATEHCLGQLPWWGEEGRAAGQQGLREGAGNVRGTATATPAAVTVDTAAGRGGAGPIGA